MKNKVKHGMWGGMLWGVSEVWSICEGLDEVCSEFVGLKRFGVV